MSFEEWKVLQLKKAGQDPTELQARRRQQQQQRAGQYAHGAGGDINIDSIGDDGEIALDFDVLNEKVSEMAGTAAAQAPGQYYEGGGNQRYGQAGSSGDGGNGASGTGGQQDKAVVYADGATQYYRSKDAGKTGKERFSFTSFDAGATILKTNKGVKNAKAVLVENKDSYMLLECRTRDKYVIVEMSDDILVDTVVVANFEFFSSMVRRFRVSVSDRYPVKADRWRTLGEFEARNSRDIQPFLIEHPQIWAKYIRIDFLTHYGSEYYCPVSLLRVHGTRMLDSWKDSENGRDYDEEMEQEEYEQQQYQQQQAEQQQTEQQQTEQQQTAQQQTEQQQSVEEKVVEPVQANTGQHESDAAKVVDNVTVNDSADFTPWNPITAHLMLFESDTVCLPFSAPASSAAHWTASGASQHGQPCYSSHQADCQDSGDNVQPTSSSSTTEHLATQPAQKSQSAANNVSSLSPTSPSSTPATTGASSLSDASLSLQSSDSSIATPAVATIKHMDQNAAANNATVQSSSGSKMASNQKIPPAVPGTPEDSQVPPTSTVPTSQTKNRAAAGGSNGAGGSSHASGSTHSGPGSNPGATGGSGSSAAGNGNNNNNNNNGGGSAPGSSSGTPSAPPPPVVQESFFKSITKRLQLLESNTSLSLQYIEDQSRFLQEALRKMERKQISRVDLFLNTLNNTVLSELRSMRQQYDQIWQSTVIALETQREQNQRETVALSDRLNVLADEVVFQKRMAILQSALLLCCLALVIFSRGLLSSGLPSIPPDVNAAAAGYMPMPPGPLTMSPSPSSPPSALSSSCGFRSNLPSRRYNFRDPYADRPVYSPGYPMQGYSAGSPPPLHNSSLRMDPSIPVDPSVSSNGGPVYETGPVPIDRNKLLPQTPLTPTSPGSPLLPESIEMEGSRDRLVDTNDSIELHDVQSTVSDNPHAVPKSLTPPASVRLSDIEEAADPRENESETDSNEDQENALFPSENTSLGPDDSSADDNGGFDPLTRHTATPPLAADSRDDAPLPTESQKRLQLLPEHSSD
ncbi:hypothetical protein SEPCBS57363_003538 [Sporothrix epigloea]|uniref:SUN domain-containing protein n=1 Tax=Sporothrix epigloea TaxID=1892477 RepID=A0ABP0DQP2_9PEZI